MSDLEKVTRAQLNNALTEPAESLQVSLSKEDSSTLLILMEGLTRRYPSQDQAESVAEYFADYEQLAIKKGLPKIEEAINALRIDPDQEFVPRPNEVAAEIERLRLKRLPSHLYAQG